MERDWIAWAETITTIFANIVGILGIPIAIRLGIRLGVNFQVEVNETRLEIERARGSDRIEVWRPYQNFMLVRQTAADLWEVAWSEGGKLQTGAARIEAPLLEGRLRGNPSKFEGRVVVGDLLYDERSEGAEVENLAVTRFWYLDGDIVSRVLHWLRDWSVPQRPRPRKT